LPENVTVPPELISLIVREITSIKVDEKNPSMFAVVKPTSWRTKDNDTIVGAQWLEDWGGPLVPFDPSKRRALEKNASALATEFIRIRKEANQRTVGEKQRIVSQ
jgi:hypothetical protein